MFSVPGVQRRSMRRQMLCWRMKWYRMLMCFVRLCATGSAAIAIADLLSVRICVGPCGAKPSSVRSVRQNKTVWVTSPAAMYSASAEEMAGVRCKRENQ